MSNFSAAVPPPAWVCGRAWECAYVLAEDFPDRLLDDREGGAARNIARGAPDRLTLLQAGAMFRLFGRQVEQRS
jgi:hypothetical protein